MSQMSAVREEPKVQQFRIQVQPNLLVQVSFGPLVGRMVTRRAKETREMSRSVKLANPQVDGGFSATYVDRR